MSVGFIHIQVLSPSGNRDCVVFPESHAAQHSTVQLYMQYSNIISAQVGAACVCLCSIERLTTTAALLLCPALQESRVGCLWSPADITARIPTLPVFGSCQTSVTLELNEKGTEQIKSFMVWLLFCLAFLQLNLVSSKQVCEKCHRMFKGQALVILVQNSVVRLI